MTAGAAAGGMLGLLAALAASAPYPAQVVISTSAGVAYLVLINELRCQRKARPTDWLAVQLLLAGNLAVFAFGPARNISWVVTTLLLASAIGLAALALYLRFKGRRHP